MAIATPQAATPSGLPKRNWIETAAVGGEVPSRGSANISASLRIAVGRMKMRATAFASNATSETTSLGVVTAAANEAAETSAPREDELRSVAVRHAIDTLIAEKASKRLLQEYRCLGSAKNRAANRALWKRNPKLASGLLLGLARLDEDVERLADVSAILASLGDPATFLIIRQLETQGGLRPMFIEMALRALRWSNALGTADHVRLEAVLQRLFDHADTDVREAAYQLATRLPAPRARALLQEATTTERDPELRDELTRFVDDIGG